MHEALRYLEDENYRRSVHAQITQNINKMGVRGAVDRGAVAIAKLVNG